MKAQVLILVLVLKNLLQPIQMVLESVATMLMISILEESSEKKRISKILEVILHSILDKIKNNHKLKKNQNHQVETILWIF